MLFQKASDSPQEHWWWDTSKSNDGGAVNDPEIRFFFKRVLEKRTNDSTRQEPWDKVYTLHPPKVENMVHLKMDGFLQVRFISYSF